jgi:hypothetical protein
MLIHRILYILRQFFKILNNGTKTEESHTEEDIFYGNQILINENVCKYQ